MTQPPDPANRPLEEQVPQPSVASPHEMKVAPGEELRWYKPAAGETLRLMGWRVIWFTPAVCLIALLFWLPVRPQFVQFFIASWKLLIVAIGLPLGFAVTAAKHAIRNRKEPFCIHCGYDLTGLQDNYTCPECGRPYTFKLIDEYRRDPHWFIERYRSHQHIPSKDVPFDAGPVRSKRKSRDGT